MSKTQNLRDESLQELDLKLGSLRKENFRLRSQKLDNKTQKTHLICQNRRDIARILTIKRQRELRGQND